MRQVKLARILTAFSIFCLLISGSLPAATHAQSGTKDRPVKKILRFENPLIMFKWVKGKWSFEEGNCDSDYFLIDVTEPGKQIRVVTVERNKETRLLVEETYIYDVLKIEDHYLRTRIQNESRMTDDGKPVEWDFFFVSEDEFLWHASHWPGLSSTPPVVRCIEEKKIAGARYIQPPYARRLRLEGMFEDEQTLSGN